MTNRTFAHFISLFALLLFGPAQSAEISNDGKQFNACTNSADSEVTISEDGWTSTCCSKTLGYCMSCSQILCVKVDYPNTKPAVERFLQGKAPIGQNVQVLPKPPTLGDQIKRSKTNASAPAKIAVPDKPPTVKQIKQDQGSKISPTTSK